MTAPARRPWWKKRRWAAASLLWLVAAYWGSSGPAAYCEARKWPIGRAMYPGAYEPLFRAEMWCYYYGGLPLNRAGIDYRSRFIQAAFRHRKASD